MALRVTPPAFRLDGLLRGGDIDIGCEAGFIANIIPA